MTSDEIAVIAESPGDTIILRLKTVDLVLSSALKARAHILKDTQNG